MSLEDYINLHLGLFVSHLHLHVLVPNHSNFKSFPCESCQLGKHTRISYGSHVNKGDALPFVLVHSNIWGPN